MSILHIQIETERIRVCSGQDGRMRIIIPPKVSGELTNVIIIGMDFKEIRAVSQDREFVFVVNPNPKKSYELWIGNENTGVMMMIGSPQQESEQSTRQLVAWRNLARDLLLSLRSCLCRSAWEDAHFRMDGDDWIHSLQYTSCWRIHAWRNPNRLRWKWPRVGDTFFPMALCR